MISTFEILCEILDGEGARIPYPCCPKARGAASACIDNIITGLPVALTVQARINLTRKLLYYFAKRGFCSPERMKSVNVPELKDALAHFPMQAVQPDVTVSALVRRHRQTPVPAVTPRLVHAAWRAYTLTEVTHPQHLVEDSHVLDHCAGKKYSLLEDETTSNISRLYYWRRIKRKQSRVFSVLHAGAIIATIDARPKEQCICDVTMADGNVHFVGVCRMLWAIRRLTSITDIKGLPALPHGYIMTATGRRIRATPRSIAIALSGGFVVTPANAHCLPMVLRNPSISLDITRCPQPMLDGLVDVRNAITSHAAEVALPHLRSAGRMHFTGGRLSLPALETADAIETFAEGGLDFPSLREATSLEFREASAIHLPRLHKADTLVVHREADIRMPSAAKIAVVRAYDDLRIDAPALEWMLSFDGMHVRQLRLPGLRSVGIISMLHCRRLDLPVLAEANALNVGLRRVTLPELVVCSSLHCGQAYRIDLPKLEGDRIYITAQPKARVTVRGNVIDVQSWNKKVIITYQPPRRRRLPWMQALCAP